MCHRREEVLMLKSQLPKHLTRAASAGYLQLFIVFLQLSWLTQSILPLNAPTTRTTRSRIHRRCNLFCYSTSARWLTQVEAYLSELLGIDEASAVWKLTHWWHAPFTAFHPRSLVWCVIWAKSTARCVCEQCCSFHIRQINKSINTHITEGSSGFQVPRSRHRVLCFPQQSEWSESSSPPLLINREGQATER